MRSCKHKRMQPAIRTVSVATLFSLLPLNIASAHPSGLQAGDAWWLAWHFDSLVVTNLLVVMLAYSGGLLKIWSRAGMGRVISRCRAIAFLLGIAALILALLSPLDTLSDDLSWVHMTQHMVLMVVAAPLMMAGSPGLAITWVFPATGRKRIGRHVAAIQNGSRPALRFILWNPLFIWSLHAVGLWIWHLPTWYELALDNPLVHDIEHLTFFGVACLFWRVAIDARVHPTLNPAASVLYLFTTSLHAMLLGVLMALSPGVWYNVYSGRTERWGFTPLEDQQLAGLIMWMPACSVYAIIAAALFASWLHQLDPPPCECKARFA